MILSIGEMKLKKINRSNSRRTGANANLHN